MTANHELCTIYAWLCASCATISISLRCHNYSNVIKFIQNVSANMCKWEIFSIACFANYVSIILHDINSLAFRSLCPITTWALADEIAPRWMPQNLTNEKSTQVQVMAWCRQTTRQYLSRCWPKSMKPYGVSRPQNMSSWYFKYEN